jgi:sensor histidine kinase YesM
VGKSGFRQALVVTFAIWLVLVYGSYCVSELVAGRTGFLRDLPIDLVAVTLVALTAQALYPLACKTAGWPLMRRGALIAGAVVLVAFVQSLINLVENRILGVIPAMDAAHFNLIRARFGLIFLNNLYLSLANAALLVFLVETRRSTEQRIALAKAEAATAEAQTVALRLQLNPHFLFNTLNSISSLIVTRRADDAEEMIERLADFLRQSLQADPNGLVPLEDEFAMVETYLDIEAVRFGDRLLVELDCPPSLAAVHVPNYILQPLAENAVKYGVARSTRPVCVRMSARTEGGDLIICIEDDAVPADDALRPTGLGVGIENVGQRLALHYGDRARITPVQSDDGFSATLIVPMPA